MTTLKLQGIELEFSKWQELYQLGKVFVFKYRKVYQLKFSRNYKNNFYLLPSDCLTIPQKETPYTLRGKFVAFNAKQANNLIGREFFV